MSLSHSLDNDNYNDIPARNRRGQQLGSLENSTESNSLDNDNIMAYFEEINQTAYEQLGSLEDSIDSYNLRLSHKIGDFLNPADNCILVNLSGIQRGSTFVSIREFLTKIGTNVCAHARSKPR